jgi:hypothetical protein
MVAAFNEVTVINRTIESLLTSRDVDVRVLVIDDGSTDGTWEAVKAAYRRRSARPAQAQAQRRQGLGPERGPGRGDRPDRGRCRRRYPAVARCAGEAGGLVRRSARRRRRRQRQGRQPPQRRHPLAGAGIHHQPERRPPGAGPPERRHRGARGHRRLAHRGAEGRRRLSLRHPGRGHGPDLAGARGGLGHRQRARGPGLHRGARTASAACSSSASAGASAPCSACGSTAGRCSGTAGSAAWPCPACGCSRSRARCWRP